MPDNKKNQNEFEIKTPPRKNEDITTSDQGNNDLNKSQNSKDNGFARKDQNKEEKGIHQEDDRREERKNPEKYKSQDVKSQQDKLNEANNQANENEDARPKRG